MRATPFLMFQGQARDALALYRSAFPDLEELLLQEHAEGEMAGQIAMAQIRFAGQEVMLYDSPPVHAFTFTPSFSFFIQCDDEAQLRRLAEVLGEGGAVPSNSRPQPSANSESPTKAIPASGRW